jgi:hypothetical protein
MRKNLKITEETHIAIKNYCEENHLKLSDWASAVLLREITNGTTEKRKTEKKLSNLQ